MERFFFLLILIVVLPFHPKLYNSTIYLSILKLKDLLSPFLFARDKLFSVQELSQFDGLRNKELYLSILGKVYDVSKGATYYGPGASYNGFVGKDGSRAFISGDFTLAGFSDDLRGLPAGELKGIVNWVELYQKTYSYKGKLIGRFYNPDGSNTDYLNDVLKKIEKGEDEEATLRLLDKKYPPCNLEWNASKGPIVWCSKRSGGVERSWVGVPRKFLMTINSIERCACVQPGFPVVTDDGAFLLYEGCPLDAEKCFLRE